MPIDIRNPMPEKLPRAPVEVMRLYEPTTEWTYSHHPSITAFDGQLIAQWSNGRANEDDVGQRVLTSVCTDFDKWSDPAPLLDSRKGEDSEVVLTAAGFHQHESRLIAYYGQYEYKKESLSEDGTRPHGDTNHTSPSLWALQSEDGRTWSAPVNMGVPIVPNHGPQPTASGRLIIAGNVMFPYTDDPAGLSGWTPAGILPADMFEEGDDSERFWLVKNRMGWPVGQCEGSFYQTDDGVLHMLLRTNTEHLWITESNDDGVTWSPPEATAFTDNATKFHFGRLPDGRFYYVGCPDPEPKWQRTRLIVSVSEDGALFDRHWILGDDVYEMQGEGLHKNGQYGYPTTLLHGGYLYVIVSRRKEAVEVIRTPLEALV